MRCTQSRRHSRLPEEGAGTQPLPGPETWGAGMTHPCILILSPFSFLSPGPGGSCLQGCRVREGEVLGTICEGEGCRRRELRYAHIAGG